MAAQRSKRKCTLSDNKLSKKKRSLGSEADDKGDGGAQILLLEQGILESRKNYNDISVLLKTAHSRDSDESLLATVALCRVFIRLVAQGSLASKKGQKESENVVAAWLRERLQQYKELLLGLLADQELAATALTLCMRIVKAEAERSGERNEYTFPFAFHQDVVGGIIRCDDDGVRQAYVEEYAEQFDDIRYYTFKSIKSLIQDKACTLFDRIFGLIARLDGVPQSADDLQDFYAARPPEQRHKLLSVKQHKKQGQEAWMAVMTLAKSKEECKGMLDIMATVIAPWFIEPELLADFLSNCYHAGGSLSLLALSGVFFLIKERNLDYPSFYPKLYSLLDGDILHSKYRSRFFRLLDTFMASTHLPAALVASFIKRLSRLALNAPPSAIAFAVPWIYNLIKRHPKCSLMIHRVTRGVEEKKQMEEQGFDDAFLAEETDPINTGAIDSSLWELVQLQSHYHPNVATIAKIISEQFTKQAYNMEDFLDHSYGSLLDAETAKEVKKAPAIEFYFPKRVFLPDADGEDSLITKMWDFGQG
ncbi:hypothetical protein CDD82_3865 [Ophiocordyceps australis]|uniref:CCAAT-binding factor domain-containing protein n=1 Tax=Ophiocordyceps australis TaxID=1399860 RepID=A0A2C5ZA41_9HYPO|nr:hypothetical protein CDD82_3865 [Ophiocordyceps australis]